MSASHIPTMVYLARMQAALHLSSTPGSRSYNPRLESSKSAVFNAQEAWTVSESLTSPAINNGDHRLPASPPEHPELGALRLPVKRGSSDDSEEDLENTALNASRAANGYLKRPNVGQEVSDVMSPLSTSCSPRIAFQAATFSGCPVNGIVIDCSIAPKRPCALMSSLLLYVTLLFLALVPASCLFPTPR